MENLAEDFNKLDISVPSNQEQPSVDSTQCDSTSRSVTSKTADQQTFESDGYYENGRSHNNYYYGRYKRKERDPTWLQVEVCRDFLRNECNRLPDECKFAHPKQHCTIENGSVITCFDSLKSRCTRERCKYYHPPKHIKKQIQQLGRSYQKIGYTYNNCDEVDSSNYETFPQYPYWLPWNLYYWSNMVPYQNGYPGYGYYNYYEVIPQNEQYMVGFDPYSNAPYVGGEAYDPMINNENTSTKNDEKCVIATDNGN